MPNLDKDSELPWKCYGVIRDGRKETPCDYIGKKDTFGKGENGPKCPKCGADDCTFPHRIFRCKKCGKVADQNTWFPELPLDDDPLAEGFEAEPCESCVDKFEHSQIGVTTDDGLDEYHDTVHELENAPAELEEIRFDTTESGSGPEILLPQD